MEKNLIVRIKGGLGNQLFSYAAARRASIMAQAVLAIDDVSGFVRDRRYGRSYALDNFAIPCRKATPRERMEPFERGRRAFAKLYAGLWPFEKRRYIEQIGSGFDERLLTFIPHGSVYLDGLWQDERHFADVADIIRSDLMLRRVPSERNLSLARRIGSCDAVALHVRWFDAPTTPFPDHNLGSDYYRQAIDNIERQVNRPHYFLFSDSVVAAIQKVGIPDAKMTVVDHNVGDREAIWDLWLMAQCQHLIMANSTFSWWAAWLGAGRVGIKMIPPGMPTMNLSRL